MKIVVTIACLKQYVGFVFLCLYVSLQKQSFADALQNKIGVLKNSANFTGKQPAFESLFNKVVGLEVCNFIKKRPQHRCFPVKFAKFFRTPFLQNTTGGCFFQYSYSIRDPMIFLSTFTSKYEL